MVVAGTALERISPATTGNGVVTAATGNDIIPTPAIDPVLATATVKLIYSIPAPKLHETGTQSWV